MPPSDIANVNPHNRLRLTTLGGALLVRHTDGQGSVVFGPGKPVALLVYLAASPGRSARREHLQDLLWADVAPDAGRHALRQLVYFIRQRAGDILEASREAVRLTDAVQSDRDELLAAADQQDCARVIDLYRGDFLPSLGLPGGGQFEQWADIERQRLRGCFIRCGEAVARRWLGEGRYRDAVALARRVRDTDPHAEPGWRLVLEGLLSASDFLGAATEADALTRFLREERREPEPATVPLLRRATATAGAEASATQPFGLTAELVGRAEQFGVLVRAWEDVRRQQHRHVHVVAPAGIGKSRLLADFAARLRARGARVARVDVRPGDRHLAQSAMGDLAAAVARLPGAAGISPGAARSLVALHPPLSSQYAVDPDVASGGESVRRRVIALHELIGAVADEGPVALLVDDLHWMDDVSRQMLTSILQRVESERVLVVTTTRPRYAGVNSARTTEIVLHPLNAVQVGALVASVATLPDEPWALRLPEELHRASDGSPLLTLETLQLLMDRGLLAVRDSTWRAPDAAALRSALAAGSALGARIGQLDPAQRAVLVTLAVAGVPTEVPLLSLAHGSEADLEAQLAVLEHRGLVTRMANGWQPSHDATGEHAAATETPDALRDVHRRLGAAYLSTSAADTEAYQRAGRHFAAANDERSLRDAFVRWLGRRRRAGDPRPLRELATEFTAGDDAAAPRVLAASVPIRLRYPRRTYGIAGAAAAVLLTAAGWASLRVPAPAPDAQLLASYVTAAGDTMVVEVPLHREEMASRTAVRLQSLQPVEERIPGGRFVARLSPDSTRWLYETLYPDSGRNDLTLEDIASGETRRLTSARTDQVAPSWAPDGRHVVYASGEFDSLQHLNIAALDLETGRVRQLTQTSATDRSPAWHPSGAFIAFARMHWGPSPRPYELCMVLADGSQTTCFPIVGFTYFNVLGWFDDERVVIAGAVSDAQLTEYAVVNARSREVHRLGVLVGVQAQLSPDGRWMTCQCRPAANADAPLRTTVFPIERPDEWRQLVVDPLDERPVHVVWQAPLAIRRHVRTIGVQSPAAASLLAPFRLHASARDADGRVVEGVPIRWRGSPSPVAFLDTATGILHPRTVGRLTVTASVSGWVERPVEIDVGEPSATPAFRVSWDSAWTDVVPFGQPRPFVYHDDALGPAIALNGDESFSSGAYTRATIDASLGLAVEAEVRTPIQRNQWQMLSIAIVPEHFIPPGASEDHEIHAGGAFGLREAWCVFGLPNGEGPGALDSIAQTSPLGRRVALPATLRSGDAYRVLMQLFPDGSCGIAINDRPLVWNPGPAIPTARYRVIASSMSHRTRIAVGQFRVLRGVVPRIDWRPLR